MSPEPVPPKGNAPIPPPDDLALGRPHDIFLRYRMAAILAPVLAEAAGCPVKSLQWAEVGAYPGEMLNFLPGVPMRLYDHIEPEASRAIPGYAVHDIARLPLPEKADAVFALDLLEHIPPEGRRAVLQNLADSVERFLILAGPFADPRVAEVEGLVHDFLRVKLGVEHRYFSEHAAHGLPDREETVRRMEAAGFRVWILPNAHLPHWGYSMILHYLLDVQPRDAGLIERLHRHLNTYFFSSSFREPAYRHFLIGAKGLAPEASRKLEDRLVPLLNAPVVPPDTAGLAALLESARMVAQDHKDQWIAQLQRETAHLEEALVHERAHVRLLLEDKAKIDRFLPFAFLRWIRGRDKTGGRS